MQVNDNVSRLTTGNLKRLATYEPDVYTYVDPSVRQSRGRAHACLHACFVLPSVALSVYMTLPDISVEDPNQLHAVGYSLLRRLVYANLCGDR